MIFEIRRFDGGMFRIIQQPKEIARGTYGVSFRYDGKAISIRSRSCPDSGIDTLWIQGQNRERDNNIISNATRWIPYIKEWCSLEGFTFIVDGQIVYTPKVLGEMQ